ncbi:MAG: hypothetical protein KatS3mg105_3304 [Gemmatales bacterium]|nr:MAG: hypothetical protein KatS3mg105_3304 [Gemmatales bacterium]
MAANAGAIRAGRAFVELFADDSRLVRGLRKAQTKLRAFGQSVSSLGGTLLRFGTTAAIPFAFAAKSFADFEQRMASVQALTSASESDFALLTKEARKLGRETVFTATQAAEAMEKFALAGLSTQEILEATAPTLNLAAVGELDMATAADITLKVLKGMQLKTSDLAEVVDVLAKSMTTANTDLQMLGEAFKFVGPLVKKAGVPLEEVSAAIQVLSDVGIQGEMAGTTIRGILLALNSPSKEAANVMRQLGVQVRDTAGNVRPLAAIFADFQRALAGMGSSAQLDILGRIFPARQATGAAVLIDQLDKLRRNIEALGDSTGTASRIAQRKLDTLTGSFKLLLSAAQDVLIEIGKGVAPLFREWAESATEVANVISRLVKNNKNLLPNIAKVVAIVVAAGAAFIALGSFLGLVSFAFGGFASAITAIGAILGLVLSYLASLASVSGAVLVAFDGLKTAFFLLTEQGKAIASAFKNLFGELATIASDGFQGVIDAISAGDLQLAGQIAMQALKVAWLEVVRFLNIAWIEFVDFLWPAIGPVIDLLTEGWFLVSDGFRKASGSMSKIWATVSNGLQSNTALAIGGAIASLVLLGPAFTAVAGGIVALWGMSTDDLSKAWDGFVQDFQEGGLLSVFISIVSGIRVLWVEVVAFMQKTWKQFLSVIFGLFKKMVRLAASLTSVIPDAIGGGEIQALLTEMEEAADATMKDLDDGIREIEKQKEKDIDRIANEFLVAQNEAKREKKERDQRRAEEKKQRLEDIQKAPELREARDQLAALIAEAKAKAEDVAGIKAKRGELDARARAARQRADGLGLLEENRQRRLAGREGTFSAAAARLLFAGLDRQEELDILRKQLAELKKLVDFNDDVEKIRGALVLD